MYLYFVLAKKPTKCYLYFFTKIQATLKIVSPKNNEPIPINFKGECNYRIFNLIKP